MQAEGRSSDCVLKPVAVYKDGARKNGVLVMCEVMMPDGVTPHESNSRATILDDPGAWFGFEQEYFFYKDGRPLGFPDKGYPAPQGPYYTGVGYSNVGDVARQIVEEHLDLCLEAGINHEGINAEVAKGQWEFQIFGKGSRKAADEIRIADVRAQDLGDMDDRRLVVRGLDLVHKPFEEGHVLLIKRAVRRQVAKSGRRQPQGLLHRACPTRRQHDACRLQHIHHAEEAHRVLAGDVVVDVLDHLAGRRARLAQPFHVPGGQGQLIGGAFVSPPIQQSSLTGCG